MQFLHCALASGTVYYNRSCLYVCVCGGWAGSRAVFATGGRCLWRAGGVCYHDNSKLRASLFTKLGL